MSACEEFSSLYGISGWTVECGLHDHLQNYLSPFGDLSFRRFSDADAETMATILAQLPPANLEDRQNHAPPLRDLCAAAFARPEHVTLSGYIVGPPRHDERLSVDGLMVVETPIMASGGWGSEPVGEERLRIWQRLGEYLGIDADARNLPDEMVPICPADAPVQNRVHEPNGWWLWWD